MREILFVVFAVFSSSSFAGLFGPDDYEECIREGLKDASTKYQVAELRRSCRTSFPDTAPKSKPLKPLEPFQPILGDDGLPLCEVIYSGGVQHIEPGKKDMLQATGKWVFWEVTIKGRNANLGISKDLEAEIQNPDEWLENNISGYRIISDCDDYWLRQRVIHSQKPLQR